MSNAVYCERVEGLRVLLQNILAVNATLVGQRPNDEIQRLTAASLKQSEEVKRISSWAAILFAPTLVPTVLLMALMCGALYAAFRHRGWI